MWLILNDFEPTWTTFNKLIFLKPIFGYLWLSQAISGYLWLSLTISGYFWLSLAISGYFWLSLAISGYLWLSLAICGHTWLSLAISGYLWLFLSIIKYQGASRTRREQVIALWNFSVIFFLFSGRVIEELALLKIGEGSHFSLSVIVCIVCDENKCWEYLYWNTLFCLQFLHFLAQVKID